MGRMKRIIALALCAVIGLALASCGDEGTTVTTTTTSSITVPDVIYKIAGNTYKADISSINVAWDEGGEEPSKYQQETFIAFLKANLGDSVITFSKENSFTLSETNGSMYDLVADDCDRIYNELYKTVSKRGNVDVVIEENKISFLCDFFISGWGMYFSMEYKLVK